MVDYAALLVDEVLPPVPIRQWVLSVPFPPRLLFAREPAVMSVVLGIDIRAIEARLVAEWPQVKYSGIRGLSAGTSQFVTREPAGIWWAVSAPVVEHAQRAAKVREPVVGRVQAARSANESSREAPAAVGSIRHVG